MLDIGLLERYGKPPIPQKEDHLKIHELLASYETQPYSQFHRDVKHFLEENNAENTENGSATKEQESTPTMIVAGNIADPTGNALRSRLEAIGKLMALYRIKPKTEDVAGRPISLTNEIVFPESFPIPTALREIFSQRINLKASEANHMLQEYAWKYGYHPIFQAALREFYATELSSLQHTFWRPLPRRQQTRFQTQDMCTQVIDEFPWLNQAERHLLIGTSRCFPRDAMSFWRVIILNRLFYLGLKDVIDGIESCENGNLQIKGA